jgi:hypothetical protein
MSLSHNTWVHTETREKLSCQCYRPFEGGSSKSPKSLRSSEASKACRDVIQTLQPDKRPIATFIILLLLGDDDRSDRTRDIKSRPERSTSLTLSEQVPLDCLFESGNCDIMVFLSLALAVSRFDFGKEHSGIAPDGTCLIVRWPRCLQVSSPRLTPTSRLV